MIAFKTWFQAPSNPEGIPTEWPWVQEHCTEEGIVEKLSQGFQVLTEGAYQAYLDSHQEDYQAWYDSKAAERLSYNTSLLIKERKVYADDLLERFKKQNISEGINVLQGIHMHSKMRAFPITISGLSFTLDIMNMAVSGDIEIACVSLQYGTPDDMSQTYHWLSAARISWLVADMKTFLGWP